MRPALGRTFGELAAFANAAPQLERGVELWRTHRGPDHRETLESQFALAGVLFNMQRWDRTEALFREVIAGYRRISGEDDLDLLPVRGALAELLTTLGCHPEAEPELRPTLEVSRRVHGPRQRRPSIGKSWPVTRSSSRPVMR